MSNFITNEQAEQMVAKPAGKTFISDAEAERMHSQEGPEYTPPTAKESRARGVAQGATFGWGDELSGLGAAVHSMHQDPLGFAKAYHEYQNKRDSERIANHEALQANPGNYIAAQVAGSLPAQTALDATLTPIGGGAVGGAVQGFGGAAGGVSQQLKDTGLGGAVGAVTGGFAAPRGAAQGLREMAATAAAKGENLVHHGIPDVKAGEMLIEKGMAPTFTKPGTSISSVMAKTERTMAGLLKNAGDGVQSAYKGAMDRLHDALTGPQPDMAGIKEAGQVMHEVAKALPDGQGSQFLKAFDGYYMAKALGAKSKALPTVDAKKEIAKGIMSVGLPFVAHQGKDLLPEPIQKPAEWLSYLPLAKTMGGGLMSRVTAPGFVAKTVAPMVGGVEKMASPVANSLVQSEAASHLVKKNGQEENGEDNTHIAPPTASNGTPMEQNRQQEKQRASVEMYIPHMGRYSEMMQRLHAKDPQELIKFDYLKQQTDPEYRKFKENARRGIPND